MSAEITTIWRLGFLAGVLSAIVAFLLWLLMPQQPKKAETRPKPEIVEYTRGATTPTRDSRAQ